ncbi:MAG: winged helix-turn-helix domain-containing protein [Candidatus Woykebacteria bacterium]
MRGLHQNEQRILNHLLRVGEATLAELRAAFLEIPNDVIDMYLDRLTISELVGTNTRKYQLTQKGREIAKKLPEVPLRTLTVA